MDKDDMVIAVRVNGEALRIQFARWRIITW